MRPPKSLLKIPPWVKSLKANLEVSGIRQRNRVSPSLTTVRCIWISSIRLRIEASGGEDVRQRCVETSSGNTEQVPSFSYLDHWPRKRWEDNDPSKGLQYHWSAGDIQQFWRARKIHRCNCELGSAADTSSPLLDSRLRTCSRRRGMSQYPSGCWDPKNS